MTLDEYLIYQQLGYLPGSVASRTPTENTLSEIMDPGLRRGQSIWQQRADPKRWLDRLAIENYQKAPGRTPEPPQPQLGEPQYPRNRMPATDAYEGFDVLPPSFWDMLFGSGRR